MLKHVGRKTLRIVGAAVVCLVAQMALVHAQAPAKKSPAKTAPRAGEPKFKAIFEPVNYKQDLKLTDVHFVNDDTGFVTGANGTILRTTDGGATWTAMLGGDASSPDEEVKDLRFLDATHGWAAKYRGKLLRTTDGENWEEFGKIGEEYGFYYDYLFLSDRIAVQLVKEGDDLARTQDGGKTWKIVANGCQFEAEVEGLARKLSCRRKSLFFLSPDVGFAIGAAIPGTYVVLFRTEDGGFTWTPQAITDQGHPDESHFWQGIVFLDENAGFAVLPRGKKFLATSDGGKTWRGVIASVEGPLKFAGRNVGWSFANNRLTYTTDGGKRWANALLRFPASVNAFSLPSPRRGYVVGDHGMIYRYRVVPIDYTSKGMIDAPMMPER